LRFAVFQNFETVFSEIADRFAVSVFRGNIQKDQFGCGSNLIVGFFCRRFCAIPTGAKSTSMTIGACTGSFISLPLHTHYELHSKSEVRAGWF